MCRGQCLVTDGELLYCKQSGSDRRPGREIGFCDWTLEALGRTTFQSHFKVAPPVSHTTAHESAATVAPFRAWRGLQRIIARGPTRDTIKPDAMRNHQIRGGIINKLRRLIKCSPQLKCTMQPATKQSLPDSGQADGHQAGHRPCPHRQHNILFAVCHVAHGRAHGW